MVWILTGDGFHLGVYASFGDAQNASMGFDCDVFMIEPAEIVK